MCEYCEERYEDMPNDKGCEFSICKADEEYTLDVQIYGYDENFFIETPINYCPMCGRKLGE